MVFPFSQKNRSGNKKAVIIGLDGVPYSLLRDYMEQGAMPRFKEIAASGLLSPMKSTLPEVSSVAWSSFMTGKNPAEHGIFGFMELDRNSYGYVFPNFSSLRSRTFWEEADMKTVAFNVPQTYPARQVNGVLVSGFVALDLEKAVYPRRVYEYLKNIGYRLDVRSNLAATDPGAFFDDLFLTLEKRMEAIKYLYDHEEWELFIGTITETDRLHHFFFDSARGGAHNPVFLRFYEKLDEFLYQMFKRAEKDGAVFMTCSDHGFVPIKSEVYVNRFLVENGLLKLSGGEGLAGMTPDSRAFCLDPARVYIHLKDKYARGCVTAGEYETLRQHVKGLFENMAIDGKKVVKKVYLKEEIFSGPHINDAPDLYVLGEPGFDMKSNVNRQEVFGLTHFRGAHTYEDAHVFVSGPGASDISSIHGIAGTLLSLCR